jgi:hypothetical protein
MPRNINLKELEQEAWKSVFQDGLVMCIVGFSLAAYFLDFSRFYAYGLLYAIPFFVRIMLEHNPGLRGISLIAYFVSAGIILLMGTIVFVCFLRNNPVVPEEASYGNH